MNLLNGATVNLSDIKFELPDKYGLNTGTGVTDITNLLSETQKTQLQRYWHDTGTPPLPTGTIGIFFTQLYNDPLGAPIDQAGKILGGTGEAITNQLVNPKVQQFILWGGIALAIYIFWPKIVKSGGR
jgi:hypothetical protein